MKPTGFVVALVCCICPLLVITVHCQQQQQQQQRPSPPPATNTASVLSKSRIALRLASQQVLVGNRLVMSVPDAATTTTTTTSIVYEFLGVPYAQAPLGDLRFRFPRALARTLPTAVYDATYARPSCMQEYDLTFPGFSGADAWNPPGSVSEDCLYFNMWVPVSDRHDRMARRAADASSSSSSTSTSRSSTITANATDAAGDYGYEHVVYEPNAFGADAADAVKRTTMLWVFGGSFNTGSASLRLYDGKVLSATQAVIVLAINYRLGPFGFFYMNSSSAPGNAGLADQVASLEFYRAHYLRYFGAATGRLCLFGESAGAMSLHNLLLSGKSGLFNRLILQSASSYLDAAFRQPGEALQVSLRLAEKVGCWRSPTTTMTLNNNNNNNNNYSHNSSQSSIGDQLKATSASVLQIETNRRQTLLASSVPASASLFPPSDAQLDAIRQCLLGVNASVLSQKQFEVEYVNEYLKMAFVPTMDYEGLVTVDPSTFDFSSGVGGGGGGGERRSFDHDILVGVNKNEGTYFAFYLYNDIYFNRSGFLRTRELVFDNAFVTSRLQEALRTRTPPPLPRPATEVSSYSSGASSTTVDEHFYAKYVSCLADSYSHVFPADEGADAAAAAATVDFDLDSGANVAARRRGSAPAHGAQLAWAKFTKIVGDVTFSCPAIRLANAYSAARPYATNFYRFGRRAASNPWPLWLGVMHGYEIEFAFGIPLMDAEAYTNEDRLVSRNMMSYWANFAKTGRLHSPFESRPRDYFVDIGAPPSAPGGNVSYSTRDSELQFNRLYANCELINRMEKRHSYVAKYELCVEHNKRHRASVLLSASSVVSGGVRLWLDRTSSLLGRLWPCLLHSLLLALTGRRLGV